VDPEEVILAAAAATVPCVLLDHAIYALQQWQRTRAGVIETGGFGPFGRTVISLFLNFFTCAVVAYIYRVIGKEQQDAFVIAACLWLMVAIPILVTSRFVDETQKQVLATRILSWLAKSAMAAASAAAIVTFGA
jgi:hypothetical protein